MNASGQLWSLDVIFAGVIFTLALGIVLSQVELSIFSTQQEDSIRELRLVAIQASNFLVSNPDLIVYNPVSGDVYANTRCGPKFEAVPPGNDYPGWISEGDLSWVESCILNRTWSVAYDDAVLPKEYLGIPEGFSYHLVIPRPGFLFSPLEEYGSPLPSSDVSQFSIVRKILALRYEGEGDPFIYRNCLDGLCADKVVDATLTVWRDS